MAKISGIIVCVGYLLFCSSNVYASSKVGPRKKTVEIAESFIGVEEATGRNDGRDIAFFLNKVGLREHNPWCAAFLAAVYQLAGVENTVTGWSKSCCPEEKVIWRRGQREVDIPSATSFWWPRERGGHTGLIVEWPKSGSKFYTIEGNVNNGRAFGGVHRLVRSKNAVHLVADWIDEETIVSAPSITDSIEVPVVDTDSLNISEDYPTSDNIQEPTEPLSAQEKDIPDNVLIAIILLVLYRKLFS